MGVMEDRDGGHVKVVFDILESPAFKQVPEAGGCVRETGDTEQRGHRGDRVDRVDRAGRANSVKT